MFRRDALPRYNQITLDHDRWPNFKPHELACFEGPLLSRVPCRHCGGEYFHDAEFLDSLQALRKSARGALRILSAHRCAKSNVRVGGAPLSQHLGLAVDLAIMRHDRHDLAQNARLVGFTGFGFYRSFLHVDKGPAREWYSSKGAINDWFT